jgi:hypothetical protein
MVRGVVLGATIKRSAYPWGRSTLMHHCSWIAALPSCRRYGCGMVQWRTPTDRCPPTHHTPRIRTTQQPCRKQLYPCALEERKGDERRRERRQI